MLIVLLGAPGEIVSREELRNRLWGEQTFVEFDNNLRVAAAKLRRVLLDDASEPKYLETVARRGYRFLMPVELILGEEAMEDCAPQQDADIVVAPSSSRSQTISASLLRRDWRISWRFAVPLAVLSTALIVWSVWRWQHRFALAEGDTVALGGIHNETGDPAYDGYLSLAFRIKMQESPFLHVVPSQQFERAIEHKVDTLKAELSACERAGGKVLVDGRLLRSASPFILRLEAHRCADGLMLTSWETRVDNPQYVVESLGDAARAFRMRLGETPAMLGRFDVPLAQATTNSLSGLRAFYDGEQKSMSGHDIEARQDYKLAIDLDPNFALAYRQLGRSYSNTGEVSLSRTYYQKAFDLRSRTTDREKLSITASYYAYATGEIDRAMKAYILWSSLYPHDIVPVNNLAWEYIQLGQSAKALSAARRAIELEPRLAAPYSVLAGSLLIAGDLQALAVLCDSKQRPVTSAMAFHLACYEASILQNDHARRQAEEQFAAGTPLESPLLSAAGEAEVFAGHLLRSRELFRSAVDSARAQGLPELASILELNSVGIRAELGDTSSAAVLIQDALAHCQPSTNVYASAAMDWALLGENAKARELVKASRALSPTDTELNGVELPVVEAVMALHEGRPQEAVHNLAITRPYDLSIAIELMPIYYRGRALLATGDRQAAVAEFENLLAHASICPRSVYLLLSMVQLTRLYKDMGQTTRAEAMEQKLELDWRAADPDLRLRHFLVDR